MTEAKKAFLRGTVQIRPLSDVKPNEWNPNVVPPHIMESIRGGFTTDGWLVSQALLIWGTDETGTVRNVIIDGEHRHTAAVQVGLTDGPMVVVDGLTETEAKTLTIKMNQKRGTWDVDALTHLLAGLGDFDAQTNALSFGFSEDEMGALMALAESQANAVSASATPQVSPPNNARATSTLTPKGPRALDLGDIQADVGSRKFSIVVHCTDRDQAVAVAERCQAEGWPFTEQFV